MVHGRGSALPRAAAPLAAGLLALGLLACSASPSAVPTATLQPSPSPAATVEPSAAATNPEATASPAPTASAVAVAPACTTTDLKASHDLVEGAAGSRLTTVVVSTANACSIDLYPAIGLRDADGTELVGGASTAPGRIDLDPNVSYSSAIQFANWCNPDPKFPLALVIRIGPDEVGVTGSSFPEQGDMPPCNGGGGPTLEAGAWQATP